MVALLAVWHNHRIAERGLHRGHSPPHAQWHDAAEPRLATGFGLSPSGASLVAWVRGPTAVTTSGGCLAGKLSSPFEPCLELIVPISHTLLSWKSICGSQYP